MKKDKAVKVAELKQPSCIMEVTLVNVYKPKTSVANGKIVHDYSIYTTATEKLPYPS